METIKFIPNYNRNRNTFGRNMLNYGKAAIISDFNIILELVIRNTLKFNKLTSADEIFDSVAFHNIEKTPGTKQEYEIDINSIKNLCDALCVNNGVLIKFEKKGMSYFKLNLKETI
jgi:hypothetical protein